VANGVMAAATGGGSPLANGGIGVNHISFGVADGCGWRK